MTAPDKPALKAATEVCADCGRFEARNRPADDWQQFENEDCWKSYGAKGDQGRCAALTIALLRTENARLLAELEGARAHCPHRYDCDDVCRYCGKQAPPTPEG